MAGANEISARVGKTEKRGAPGKKKEKIGLTSEPSPQVLGYICVSAGGANDDTQLRALLAAGVAESNIYCDSLVARSDVRTALAGCSERLREGDSIVLWTLNAFDENEGKVNLIVQGLAYRGILIRTLSIPEVPLNSSEEPQKTVPKTARISNLDALRGFAAIAVVVFHAIIILNFELSLKLLATPIYKINNLYDLSVKTMLVFFNGGVAVALFFILSGAVLFRSLQFGNGFNYLAARNFTVSRVFRIYPMLVAALVLLFAIVNISHAFLPTMFPVSYRANDLMQNLILANPSMHGASWTLQIEMIAIPVILLLYAGCRFGGITILLLAVLYSSLATFVAINHHTESLSLNSALLRECLLYFSLGMLVATAQMRLFVQRLPGRLIWAIFVVMLFSRHVIEDLSTGILVTAYCACILVAWLYHGESINFLTRRIPLWLGRISYSVYLLNVMIMILVMQMLYWMNEPLVRSHYLEFGILLSVVTVAFTLPLASWTERWIEKPFINFGKHLNARAAKGGTVLPGLRQEAAAARPIAVH